MMVFMTDEIESSIINTSAGKYKPYKTIAFCTCNNARVGVLALSIWSVSSIGRIDVYRRINNVGGSIPRTPHDTHNNRSIYGNYNNDVTTID